MTSPRFGCSDGFSLAGRMSDRRARRRMRVPHTVQVVRNGEAAHARCRDFSDTGMKLDLTAPLYPNDVVTVALSPSIILCGTVAWVRGSECGVVFDGPVDSAALLDAVEPPQGLLEAPATLTMLGGNPPCRVGRPDPGVHFKAGLAVTVIGPTREQRGLVRWAKDNVAALEFTAEPETLLLPAPGSTKR